MHVLFALLIYYVTQQSTGKEPVNVALLKPVWMSSLHEEYGNPSYTVDGRKKNTDIQFCAHTATFDDNPWRWWRIDLLAYHDIYYVQITNRGDCCGYRLRNFKVLVATALDGMNEPMQNSEREKLCYHFQKSVNLGEEVRLDCYNKPIIGRYVTVLLPSQTDEVENYGSPLQLCEVEIYGLYLEYSELVAGQSCNDGYQCVHGTICDGSICRLVVGSYCSDPENTLCQTGSLCDFDYTCKLDYDGDCFAEENSCRRGLVCDNSYRCRIRVGDSCSASEDLCVSGAHCLEGKCACVSVDLTIERDSLCYPAVGRVGGVCSVGSSCIDPYAFCNQTLQSCLCTEIYNTDYRNYSCISTAKATAKAVMAEKSADWLWAILVLTIAVPAVVVTAYVSARRRQEKRETALP